MRRIVPVLVVALLAATVTKAPAQPPQRRGFRGFGGGSVFLLLQESVRKELQLTDEQIDKLREARDQLRPNFRELRGLSREEIREKIQEMREKSEKLLADILKPEQLKRLKQIELQQQGLMGALRNREVASSLGLTEDQREQLRALQQDFIRAMRDLRESGGDRREMFEKIQEFRKSTEEKILKVLTSEQKAKWKELTGEPFKGEIRRGFGRRGGRGGRPPADRP